MASESSVTSKRGHLVSGADFTGRIFFRSYKGFIKGWISPKAEHREILDPTYPLSEDRSGPVRPPQIWGVNLSKTCMGICGGL